jgi:hypothetical protein
MLRNQVMSSGRHAARLCSSSCPDSTLRLAPGAAASAAAASGATANASAAGEGGQKSGHSSMPEAR